jgi:hypothetical protein
MAGFDSGAGRHLSAEHARPLYGAKNLPEDSIYPDTGVSRVYIPVPTDRCPLGDRSNLRPNADGSIDIYLQSTSQGTDKESNWLPTPPQPFSLHARL